jgi:hypothetical protein
MRRKIFLFFVVCFLSQNYVMSDEINFPPELFWWINEIKTVNKNVKISDFTLFNQETRKFNNDNFFSSAFLVYPVFMRWNYSGNMAAYYNFNSITLKRQNNGKYEVSSGDVDSHFVLTDKNKKIFFIESFGSLSGIYAYNWLTDTVLVTVGSWINMDENDKEVDLFIQIYSINSSKKIVEIKTYIYGNALTVEERNNLKLNWYEHRTDYFEIK